MLMTLHSRLILGHGENILRSFPPIAILVPVQGKAESVVLDFLGEERHEKGGDDDEDEESGHGTEDTGDEQPLVLRSVQLSCGCLELWPDYSKCLDSETLCEYIPYQMKCPTGPVSYTHLTLPTRRTV